MLTNLLVAKYPFWWLSLLHYQGAGQDSHTATSASLDTYEGPAVGFLLLRVRIV